jgi:hypothetical protein
MKPIDVRPRVGKIIEEPQQVDRILSTYHQHRESFRVKTGHTKRFSPKNPYRASPICLKCALALRFSWWPQNPSGATQALEAHQLGVLLSGGDPAAAQGVPPWRRVDVQS